MNSTVQTLSGLHALQGLRDEHLEKLANIAHEQSFAPGAVIFREGEPASDIYLVVAGSVSLEICAPGVGCRRILTLTDGELLGWSPVLEQAKLTATARAQAATRAIKINGRELLTLCDADPQFGYEFMRRAALALAKRLSATRLQLLDVYGTQMPPGPESGGRP